MRIWTLCLALFMLAACSKTPKSASMNIGNLPGATKTAAKPLFGGTFVWGKGADAIKLDPANITDGESVTVTGNIFDTLVAIEKGKTNIIPSLATSWDSSTDRLTWTFRLREGVRFHDGSEFNAAAVVFSFKRQMDEKHPARRPGDVFAYYHDQFKSLKDVVAKGTHKVVFTLSKPHEPFLAALALFSSAIVSPTAFASNGVKDGRYVYDFAKHPVGTGPFVFKLWEKDTRIVLDANDRYWDGRPPIDTLIFKPIKDPHARLKELQSGGLNGMDNPALADLGSIAKDPNLKLLGRPGVNVCYLAMNTQKGPFRNSTVRQAIALAINKARIIEAAYDGMAEPAVTMCPKTMRGHHPITDRQPSVGQAKAKLKEVDFDGGFTCTLYHMANQRAYITNPSGVAIQIQQDLRQIGITVKLKKLDWTAYLAAVQNGEHDMCLMGWMADIADPDNFLYVLLDKDNAEKGQAQNVSFYRDEEVHQMLVQAQQASAWKTRLRLYAQVQQRVFDDCPVVPLATVHDFRVLRKNVRGYTIYPVGGEFFRHVSLAK